MLRVVLIAISICPITVWAQINAAANLEIPNPPLRAPSGFNGFLLMNETEFLTPQGILDNLPQQAHAAENPIYEDVEPAAGMPETVETSPETPVTP